LGLTAEKTPAQTAECVVFYAVHVIEKENK
jgi:hypothetical protein